MDIKSNVVGWFELPVNDMDRAIKFYETVFGFELSRNTMGPLDMAWFPWVDNGQGAAGSLVHYPDFYKPTSNGSLIYFTAHSGDLSIELARVEKAGGQVIQEKKLITEDVGFMGLFIDTEGNRVAMHSRK